MTFVKCTTSDLIGAFLVLILLSFPFLTFFNPIHFGVVLTICLSTLLVNRTFIYRYSAFDVFSYLFVPITFVVCSFFYSTNVVNFIDEFLKFLLAIMLFCRYKDILGGRYTNGVFYVLSIVTVAVNFIFANLGFLFEYNDDGGRRFLGTFGSVNLTSYVLVLMGTYLFLNSRFKNTITLKMLYVAFLCYIQYISGTKSLLIIIPFVVFIFFNVDWNVFSKKCLFFIFLGPCFIFLFIVYSFGLLDFVEIYFSGGSLDTRVEIYKFMLLAIYDSYVFIPSGVGFSDSRMELFFSGFPVHNDLLKYLADYGVFFVVMLYIIFFKNRVCTATLKQASLLLFILSAALHNNLFSPYVLIPYFMIITTGEKIEER